MRQILVGKDFELKYFTLVMTLLKFAQIYSRCRDFFALQKSMVLLIRNV